MRFAQSGDLLAGPAYGLLDESLATAFGMMVMGLVDPTELTHLANEPNGFYDDPWIDALAKKLMPMLQDWLARGKTIYDRDFVASCVRRDERSDLARPVVLKRAA